MSELPGIEPKQLKVDKAFKAYDNAEFLHSKDGRTLRILSEYLFPEQYFRKHKVKKTIVFYGSARTISSKEYELRSELLKEHIANSQDEEEKAALIIQVERLEKIKSMCGYYDDCVKLSEMLTDWTKELPVEKQYIICTGGGPGMMEAANRGAFNRDFKSIGLNISLPFEQFPNQYIHPDLNFEFHYFFMRKFWFVYLAQAIIAMPGGYGTLDEIMEILTLRQTYKVTRGLPIVLYGEDFWRELVNFDFLVEKGLIDVRDLDLFIYASKPEDAFEYITGKLKILHKL